MQGQKSAARSIILAARHDKGRVDVIVRLFGGLYYFVQLSDHYAGAEFSYTLVNDATRGEFCDVLQSHVNAEILETEDVATSGESVWNDLAASGGPKHGCKIVVTFKDGEELFGTTEAYNPKKLGFFMFPPGKNGNNLRVFVVNRNVRQIKMN